MGLVDYVNNTHHQSDALVRLSPDQRERLENAVGERRLQLYNGTEPVLGELIIGKNDLKATWHVPFKIRVTHIIQTLGDGSQQRLEIGAHNLVEGDSFTVNLR